MLCSLEGGNAGVDASETLLSNVTVPAIPQLPRINSFFFCFFLGGLGLACASTGSSCFRRVSDLRLAAVIKIVVSDLLRAYA